MARRPTSRDPSVRVKTARGRKVGSTLWLQRQLNDPYVRQAKHDGYRSRAAYKLIQLNEKLKFLKPGLRVVDLGAAPGGWCQVLSQQHVGQIVAIDILPMDPLPGVEFLHLDFSDDSAPQKLIDLLKGPADIVLSDLAPNVSGHKQTDHIRLMALLDIAVDFARQVLKPEGVFIAKIFQGGAQAELQAQLKRDFKTVKHIKPAASRSDSSETYICATGYRGQILQDKVDNKD